MNHCLSLTLWPWNILSFCTSALPSQSYVMSGDGGQGIGRSCMKKVFHTYKWAKGIGMGSLSQSQ